MAQSGAVSGLYSPGAHAQQHNRNLCHSVPLRHYLMGGGGAGWRIFSYSFLDIRLFRVYAYITVAIRGRSPAAIGALTT